MRIPTFSDSSSAVDGSPPAVDPQPPPPPTGWGLAALITGIVAISTAVIPVLNYFAWAVALVGIGLAIVAMTRENTRLRRAIVSLALSLTAFVLSIVLAVVYTVLWNWMSLSPADSKAQASTPAAKPTTTISVVYEVTGDGGTAVVDYIDWGRGSASINLAGAVSIPFRATVEFPSDLVPMPDFTVMASAGEAPSTISCRVLVGGVVVDEKTETGSYANAICKASG